MNAADITIAQSHTHTLWHTYCQSLSLSLSLTHTHRQTHARTLACMHARTLACMHARKHAQELRSKFNTSQYLPDHLHPIVFEKQKIQSRIRQPETALTLMKLLLYMSKLINVVDLRCIRLLLKAYTCGLTLTGHAVKSHSPFSWRTNSSIRSLSRRLKANWGR